jgi:hypothetical protein
MAVTARLLLCGQNLIRDADTNNVSVINIFEGMIAQGFPLLMPTFAFLTILERENGDPRIHEGRFDIRLGDTVLVAGPMRVDFQDKPRTRTMLRVAGLVINAPGLVSARFFIGQDQLGEYHFEVGRAAGPVAEVIVEDPVANQPGANAQPPQPHSDGEGQHE